MTPHFKKTRLLWALTFLGVALFCVWWQPLGLFQPVRVALSTVLAPFENAFAWGAFEVKDFRDFLSAIGRFKTENADLERENLSLRAHIAQLAYLQGENASLRSLVSLTETVGQKSIPAEVIARDGSGLSTTLMVSAGSHQGVKNGLAVVSPEKVLVGKVTNVFPESAEVMLLPNPESVVSAALATNDSKGVIKGDHGLGMFFDLALQSDELKPGAAIVSSGLGDALPPGLLIGTIESTHPSADRLFQQAVVVSPVRFDSLRFVAILSH